MVTGTTAVFGDTHPNPRGYLYPEAIRPHPQPTAGGRGEGKEVPARPLDLRVGGRGGVRDVSHPRDVSFLLLFGVLGPVPQKEA